MGFSLSVRNSQVVPEWGYRHEFARAATKEHLQQICEFTDNNVQWEQIPNSVVAKHFAVPYAQLSARKFLKKKRHKSIAVVMPRALEERLGNGTETVAPATDNVYTMAPAMQDAAYKKGQNMLREVGGDEAVISIHELMEAMESFGSETDATKEANHKAATRARFVQLRDHLIGKFGLPAQTEKV